MSGNDMSRREFLNNAGKAAIVGAVALGAGYGAAQPANVGAGASRVVRVCRASSLSDGKPQAEVVRRMVNAAVEKLSGKRGADAWRAYFRPEDIVGVKINCLFGIGASTRQEVTEAVVAGIRTAGVKPDNIIVWDRDEGSLLKAGYTINRGAGVKCQGTDWAQDTVTSGVITGRLATVLYGVTALVNVPVLKHHAASGISLAMKNHYGSLSNPGAAHGNNCDPYIADLNLVPLIRDKQRLIIADALRPIADGGPTAQPAHTWDYGAILAATDPVAIDQIGLTILDTRRAEKGLSSIEKSGLAKHIATAARKGLGTNDMGWIEVVEA
jgi:uncharacterized protein (DUF362 family)